MIAYLYNYKYDAHFYEFQLVVVVPKIRSLEKKSFFVISRLEMILLVEIYAKKIFFI